uniref:non-specific serine/threonine protein kinase n=1 Tax=Anopheles epiroticus TaxID=199890 RepID=A0A182PE90_9DIPT
MALRRGMFGIVRSAISKQSGISYAAKFLRRRRRGKCCLSEINHEIAVLMLCAESDHVVKLHAVHETRAEIALILELATGGDLQTLIDEQGYGLKLCDFGIARFMTERNKIYEIVGTPDYVAPEVLHYDPLSLRTDIWSIGVVAYVLLTGLSPFGGDSKQETFLNITKCSLTFPDEVFGGISSDAIDFIKSVLRIKPKERLTVDECLEHRWLQETTVCLREEMLAARATLSGGTEYSNGDVTGPKAAPVQLENGRNSCSNVVRLHENGDGGGVAEMAAGPVDSTNACINGKTDESNNDGNEGDEGGGGTSPALLNELKQHTANATPTTTTTTEDNKENVIVGGLVAAACTLFPDAPTTPKVSRKALPVEPLNDGGQHHYHHLHHNNHHHHNHHHHHHHYLQQHNHHHLLHHSSNSSGANNSLVLSNNSSSSSSSSSNNSQHLACQAVMMNPSSATASVVGGGSVTAAAGPRQSPDSPSFVKKYIQKMHIHQQLPDGGEGGELLITTLSPNNPHSSNGVTAGECKLEATQAAQKDTALEQHNGAGSVLACCNNARNGGSSNSSGEVECCTPDSTSSYLTATMPAAVSNSSGGNSSSCRTTLCALHCAESSVVGSSGPGSAGDARHLVVTSSGHKTLQQCDKDAIIC